MSFFNNVVRFHFFKHQKIIQGFYFWNFPKMVNICIPGSNIKTDVPLNTDNSLPLKRLERYFPGAVGLYYTNGEQKVPVL